MSLNEAKVCLFNQMEKGRLVSTDEIQDILKTIHETELEHNELHELNSWIEDIATLAPFKTYIQDHSINEIIIHDEENLQIEVDGNLHSKTWIPNDVSLKKFMDYLTIQEHQTWNYLKPFCSFKKVIFGIPFRVTVIHQSLSPNLKPKIFLRKLRSHILNLSDFSVTEEEKNFLEKIVHEKKNVLVCGATGSGKTTLLSSLLQEIPENEHVVLMEDVHELILERKFFTYLLADEEAPKKTLKEYCKYSLRLRPDRIIIGELRGEETVPFLLSMNNGHKGLMSTIHSKSAKDAPTRLAMLFSLYSNNQQITYELALKLICANVEIVVYMENKKIKEVVQILGCEGVTPYYEKIF
jgi:Flp pilus assembly CpaF family ATPase